MEYNFVKDIYKSIVLEAASDNSVLETFISDVENSFILKHNIEALTQLLKFLNSSDNIFILNGFMGAGKTYVVDCFLEFISDDVLVFKNSYQEAINLDDILLSLFKDFSIYHNEKKIILPKVDSSIFSEKINAYIKYCNVPMLFVFDSFEINMRSKDTQKDILNFINYLSHFEKVKIVICSRSFGEQNLLSSESPVCYALTSLTKEEMYNFLAKNNIKGGKYEMEELYKVTRGHYLLLELSVLIMQILNISLTIFSSEYKKSAKNFLEFMISKLLSVSAEKFVKLLLFLATIRHGVSHEFLIVQKIATEDDILFLLQKHILSEKFGKYYLKNYVKNEFIKSINTETKLKVHKYLIELYEAELPLKPFERALFLSRQTMRQEIAFHKNKIEILENELKKSGRSKSKLAEHGQDITYLSYLRTSGYDAALQNKKPSQKRYISKMKQKSNEKKRRFELSKDDSRLLHSSSQEENLSKEFQSISKINTDEEIIVNEPDFVPSCLKDYIEIAQNYEDAYNFSNAILYYKKALTYTNDEMFEEKEPIIYTKLAICYKKIQDTNEAVRFYEKVYNIYIKTSQEKANSILLAIAQIYFEVYKFEKAKETYKRILYSKENISIDMVVRVYLDLSELEDNNHDIESSIKYLQKALAAAEKLSDVKLLSECYFKYALVSDDTDNLDLAVKYYLRCVQVSNNPEENLYLSSAYYNLAELSLDKKNMSAAKMYYQLAIEADKKQNNYEGLYYSYTKLADLYKPTDIKKTYELLIKALSASKRFDDITYTVNVYIELGDYYYNIKDYKKALKAYMMAKTLAPKHSVDDISSKINIRIDITGKKINV